jgi:hypothetical protein
MRAEHEQLQALTCINRIGFGRAWINFFIARQLEIVDIEQPVVLLFFRKLVLGIPALGNCFCVAPLSPVTLQSKQAAKT